MARILRQGGLRRPIIVIRHAILRMMKRRSRFAWMEAVKNGVCHSLNGRPNVIALDFVLQRPFSAGDTFVNDSMEMAMTVKDA